MEVLDPLKNEVIVAETGKLEEEIGISVDLDIGASLWLELIMDSLFVGSNERLLMSDMTFTLKSGKL